MYAKNRRNERRDDIIEHIKSNNSKLCTLIDFSFWEEENLFLEGTGSIIFDHKQKIAYASISERTDSSLFKIFCKTFGYKAMAFHSFQTVNNKRLPIYHTNVMLSIAEEFAVICSQAIDNQTERLQVLHSLEKSGKQILEISENQMSKFAGNMLQIRNKQNQKFTVLSETAYLSLQQKQLELLISFNPMIICPIPNIEKVGGGSVRCMMAEIFK